MRKRKKGRKLSRERNQRNALLCSLAINLVEQKRIKTTLAKAKELRPFVEKKITLAKRCKGKEDEIKIAKIRLLKKDFSQKTIKELFELASLFNDRKGGYVRILKVTDRRSDNAPMAIIEWTDKKEEERAERGKKESDLKKDGGKKEKDVKDKKKNNNKKEQKDEKKDSDDKTGKKIGK